MKLAIIYMTGTKSLYKFNGLPKQLHEVGTITTHSLLIRTWGSRGNICLTRASSWGAEEWDLPSDIQSECCPVWSVLLLLYSCGELFLLPSPENPALSLPVLYQWRLSASFLPWISLWSFRTSPLSYWGRDRRPRSLVLPSLTRALRDTCAIWLTSCRGNAAL